MWTKATERVGTCEVQEERLHEVEPDVKELRVDSCLNFQVRCNLTCTLGLLVLLIITTWAAAWICVRTCLRRAVETNIDVGQKSGIAHVAHGGGMVR